MRGLKSQDQEVLRDLAAQSCAECGLELWDLSALPGRVIVTIEKEGGVSLDDCEALSRTLERRLDTAASVSGPYRLEVQSPGPQRRVRGPDDVLTFRGREAKATLKPGVHAHRHVTGRLEPSEDADEVRLRQPDGSATDLRWLDIVKLNLTGRDEGGIER